MTKLGRQAISSGITKDIYPHTALEADDGEWYLQWTEGGNEYADVFLVPEGDDETALATIASDDANIRVSVQAGSSDLLAQCSVVSTSDDTPEPLPDAFIASLKVTITAVDYFAAITDDEIDLHVPTGTDLEDLDLVVVRSSRSTIDPATLTGVDASAPVTITVTAQDGTTEREYTLTATADL